MAFGFQRKYIGTIHSDSECHELTTMEKKTQLLPPFFPRDSGDCLLTAEPEKRFLHPSKIQMSGFAAGDSV